MVYNYAVKIKKSFESKSSTKTMILQIIDGKFGYPSEIRQMMRDYFCYGSHLKSSNYWDYLNIKNLKSLYYLGFDNFK